MSFKRNSSFPNDLNNVSELKSSPSLDSFLTNTKTNIIEFEGDGELGIIFQNIDNDIIVYNIKKDTVANEYYELELDMKLIKVNSFLVENFSYIETIKLIDTIWYKNNKIELELIQMKNKVFKFLEDNNLSEYYYIFKELGAKTIDDFKYIEYGDLMNIPYLKRNELCKKINVNIPD